MASAAAIVATACTPTLRCSWRRVKPSARSVPSSRRRLRTESATAIPSSVSVAAANRIPTSSGMDRTLPASMISGGRTGATNSRVLPWLALPRRHPLA